MRESLLEMVWKWLYLPRKASDEWTHTVGDFLRLILSIAQERCALSRGIGTHKVHFYAKHFWEGVWEWLTLPQ